MKLTELEMLESPIVKAYEKELSLIKSPSKRSKLQDLLRTAAYKNIQGQASSTGKYHPKFANTDFGLSKHTKAVVRFVRVICAAFPELDEDTMIIAAIAHDMFKYATDDDKYTSKYHAKDAGMALHQAGLKDEARLVYAHMGNFDKDAAKPEEFDEKCLHLADFLASQKFIDIKFVSDHNLLEEKLMLTFDEIHKLHEGTGNYGKKEYSLFDKPTKGAPKYVVHNDYVLERIGKDYEVIEKVWPRDFNGWVKKHCEVRPVYSHWLEDDRVKMKVKLAVVEYEKGL